MAKTKCCGKNILRGNKKIMMQRILLLYIVTMLALGIFPVAAQEDSVSGKDETALPGKESAKIIYGTASYYYGRFHGRKTASGEIFNQHKLTAACNVLPLGTWVRVTNLRNKKSVVVKINDRMHHRMKRAIDLSKEAARQLGFLQAGLAKVRIEVLNNHLPSQKGEY
jgi:rare lipoprotein A